MTQRMALTQVNARIAVALTLQHRAARAPASQTRVRLRPAARGLRHAAALHPCEKCAVVANGDARSARCGHDHRMYFGIHSKKRRVRLRVCRFGGLGCQFRESLVWVDRGVLGGCPGAARSRRSARVVRKSALAPKSAFRARIFSTMFAMRRLGAHKKSASMARPTRADRMELPRRCRKVSSPRALEVVLGEFGEILTLAPRAGPKSAKFGRHSPGLGSTLVSRTGSVQRKTPFGRGAFGAMPECELADANDVLAPMTAQR